MTEHIPTPRADTRHASSRHSPLKAAKSHPIAHETPNLGVHETGSRPLTALESMIALVATQLPPPARDRFATALRELEETGPDLNARRSWSAALRRVRSLISE